MNWIDNHSVQLMITIHSIDDVSKYRHYLNVRKKYGIFDQSISSIYFFSIAIHSNQLFVALPHVEYQPKVGIIIITIIASCGYQAY